jgi:transcriptional regulator with XRE-family HTH domain
MSHFGELLKKARQRTWLTQKELGEKVGVDDSYISRLERGVYQPPSREVAEGLAGATSMSNKPVTLYVSTKDMDAIDRFVFLLEANVAGAEDVKEIRLVKIEYDEKDEDETEEEDQTSAASLPGMVNPALALPDSLFDNLGGEIEEIKGLIASTHLTEEEEKIVKSALDTAKRLLLFIEAQRKMRKDG